jgi:hypothetical protein
MINMILIHAAAFFFFFYLRLAATICNPWASFISNKPPSPTHTGRKAVLQSPELSEINELSESGWWK